MPFRLKRKESVPAGLHRIMREEFVAAEIQLRALRVAETRQEHAVHEARKHLKKLRALCRIWRESVESELAAHESDILKEVGRNFAAVRDAEVSLALFSSLMSKSMSRPNAHCRELIAGWKAEHERLLHEALAPNALAQNILTLAASRNRFELFPLEVSDWKILSHALRRSYRCARKAFRQAVDDPQNEEAWHDWRKATKVLYYQLTLLKRASAKMEAEVNRLDKLTEMLGQAHDLALLSAAVLERQPEFGDTPSGAKVLALARRQHVKLKSNAATAGGRVFLHPVRRFVEKVHTAWKKWR